MFTDTSNAPVGPISAPVRPFILVFSTDATPPLIPDPNAFLFESEIFEFVTSADEYLVYIVEPDIPVATLSSKLHLSTMNLFGFAVFWAWLSYIAAPSVAVLSVKLLFLIVAVIDVVLFVLA